jgi:calcium-dependent protein kinase
MLCGNPPFQAETDTAVLKKVRKGKFKFEPEFFWDSVGEDAKKLISHLLVVDAGERLSAPASLTHSFFRMSKMKPPCYDSVRQTVRKILAFEKMSWFKRTSLQIVANQLPEGDVDDLRQVFLEIDAHHWGRLRPQEISAIPGDPDDSGFGDAQRTLVEKLKQGFTVLNKEINYTTFLAATLDASRFLNDAAARSAFKMLDLDDDGMIRMTELKIIRHSRTMDEETGNAWEMDKSNYKDQMRKAQDSESDDECLKFLQKYDRDNDEALNFNEFMDMMRDAAC